MTGDSEPRKRARTKMDFDYVDSPSYIHTTPYSKVVLERMSDTLMKRLVLCFPVSGDNTFLTSLTKKESILHILKHQDILRGE